MRFPIDLRTGLWQYSIHGEMSLKIALIFQKLHDIVPTTFRCLASTGVTARSSPVPGVGPSSRLSFKSYGCDYNAHTGQTYTCCNLQY